MPAGDSTAEAASRGGTRRTSVSHLDARGRQQRGGRVTRRQFSLGDAEHDNLKAWELHGNE